MWKNIHIRQHEIGLWFRHGDLHRVLGAGSHRALSIWPWSRRDSVEIADTLRARFSHELLKVLATDARLVSKLIVLDLEDDERALVWIDGRLDSILAGGHNAFWNTNRKIEIERFRVSDLRFEHAKLHVILRHPDATRLLSEIVIDANERVMLFRDGELVERLGPGRFVHWNGGSRIKSVAFDLREQVVDIQGQEFMTADRVTLRVNLVVTYRVKDPVKAVTEVVDWQQALYREAQLELRSVVGGRTLDQLLSDKDEVGAEVQTRLAERVREFGVSVTGVGLRDLILPGEMKVILNAVITAQKQAEANLIRRREETAAARSQANTAKLLADNPVLARMKELEAMQEIIRGSNATFVLGSGDLSEQISGLMRRVSAPDAN